MTSAPTDLLAFRALGRSVTGLPAAEFGIAPDPRHLASGGYHVGVEDIQRIGRWSTDYSTRQTRDRRDGSNTSSATDVGAAWRNGGRAAWLRWNVLLYQEMRDRPQNLPALRAINVALDGRTKQRYDQLHRGDGLIPSTDTVDGHTHLEFWRDTEGNRPSTLDRIVELMRAAVANTPAAPATTGDDDMDLDDSGPRAILPGVTNRSVLRTTLGILISMMTGQRRGDLISWSAIDVPDNLGPLLKSLAIGGIDIDALAAKIAAQVGPSPQVAERLDRIEKQLAATRAAAEANLSTVERASLDGAV